MQKDNLYCFGLGYFSPFNLLKVSKFRKQIDLFSFEPKTEQNISAQRIDPLGQKYFVWFLVQMSTGQSAFEIY